MAEVTLDNTQGDLFNRGFPKFNEVYYFFSIVSGKEKEFSKALKTLVSEKDKHISSLKKVLADWAIVDAAAKKNRTEKDRTGGGTKGVIHIVATSNALIAFSKRGLDKIQVGLGGNSLGLNNLKLSDPAFNMGMAMDGPNNLNDPPSSTWDPLFNIATIHGLLKVAGSSRDMIERKLNDIKSILGHPTVIKDIPGQSPPTNVNSRLDGHVRPWVQHKNGLEHFGFRDGISQPLLKGINSDAAIESDKYMETDQNIITVSKKPPGTQDGIDADPTRRPDWMIGGSFLAFRKLEQDVQGWINLVNKFASADCSSADQCGAKLIGRWKSGAPITLYPEEDPHTTEPTNDFKYKGVKKFVCPMGAHIRKVNPRTQADAVKMARMVRNGIPYGSEFSEKRDEKRGLLFACYQSSLENSFQFVQRAWSNTETFPTSRTGYDPLIGQAKDDGLLHTTLQGPNEEDIEPGLGKFPQMVTMRGGEYFFVPSISALSDTLGSD